MAFDRGNLLGLMGDLDRLAAEFRGKGIIESHDGNKEEVAALIEAAALYVYYAYRAKFPGRNALIHLQERR